MIKITITKDNSPAAFTQAECSISQKETLAFVPDVSPETPKKILFVCSGNTCRSPMAQAYFNYIGQAAGFYAVSAGIFPEEGTPISENAVKALKNVGVFPCDSNPYTSHTSARVSSELILGCDQIIGLTERHAMLLIQLFPQAATRICSFPNDISDPFGGGIDVYTKCLNEIILGINEMFPFLRHE
ncbi:MAG: hypothetical protein PUE85_00180 [Firmicutes bacterium]|nr:hypothetical protein [Bacillota bacterium]